MVAKIFDDILVQGVRKNQIPGRTQAARNWFRQKAMEVKKIDDRKLLQQSKEQFRQQTSIGNMFMYFYDPKHKKTLPYYDRFPLIFVIGKAKGGFMGLNMHYLPPQMRATLMDALYDVKNNNRFDESTKLKLSYDILKNASKFRFFKPAIKRYLTRHVRSRIVFVPSTDWDVALFLPTARWEKASATKIWAESRKIIKRG